MQTPNQASVVFRNVESMLCEGVDDEICGMKTNQFNDYVEMLALDNKLRLSDVYDMFSTCAPCIQETFDDSTHDNCNVKLMDEVSCGDLSNHVMRASKIFDMTYYVLFDTPHAFENAYHMTNICTKCFDEGRDCKNDVSEFSETMETCKDIIEERNMLTLGFSEM